MLHLINILKNMEVNMNRLFGLLFALFFVFYCKADNLSVPMAGNGNGKYLNSSVQILLMGHMMLLQCQ